MVIKFKWGKHQTTRHLCDWLTAMKRRKFSYDHKLDIFSFQWHLDGPNLQNHIMTFHHHRRTVILENKVIIDVGLMTKTFTKYMHIKTVLMKSKWIDIWNMSHRLLLSVKYKNIVAGSFNVPNRMIVQSTLFCILI